MTDLGGMETRSESCVAPGLLLKIFFSSPLEFLFPNPNLKLAESIGNHPLAFKHGHS